MDTRFQPAGFRSKDRYFVDTTLSLDTSGSSSLYTSSKGNNKRKWSDVDNDIKNFQDDFSLIIGVGRPSNSSDNSKMSSTTACTMSSAKETDEETSMDLDLNFQLHLESDNTNSPNKPAFDAADLQLNLPTGSSFSAVTHQNRLELHESFDASVTGDDGSTSSRWKSGGGGLILPSFDSIRSPVASPATPLSATAIQEKTSCISEFVITQLRRHNNSKTCLFQDCKKGARGASGLCIGHGGGRRCQREGCVKGAEGRTVYCKSHGGGRRCNFLGCTKSAEGRTDYCIAHGGGQRCSYENCTRASRGKTGFCIKHGGGKRCQEEGCTKSAEGYTGRCISHGGGRRCQYPSCTKGAQGSTMLCKAHGGGKRCTFFGCNKGAEGSTLFCKGHGGGKRCTFQCGDDVCPKSVHGGTLFCVRHGGGKRCAIPECPSSARGSTAFCVSHGGGKRCKFEGCSKSAQGSTDFCKAHGGGKRCSWGKMASVLGIPSGSLCDRYPKNSDGLCAAHSSLVHDRKIHGGGTLGFGALDNTMKERYDSPPLGWIGFKHSIIPKNSKLFVPEGRVHGGSLMTMLAGSNTGISSHCENHANSDSSTLPNIAACSSMPHKWV